MFLDQDTTRVDYPALNYLTGECNYGGRVTDDKDRRLISTLLLDYYCPEFGTDENYKFVPNDEYIIRETINTRDDYIEKFRSFPNITNPSVFGFHSNADITKDIGESNLLLDSLLICSGASSVIIIYKYIRTVIQAHKMKFLLKLLKPLKVTSLKYYIFINKILNYFEFIIKINNYLGI